MNRSEKNFMFHPRSRFDAFLEGRLSESADQKVRQHLAHCPDCAEEVEQRSRALQVTRKVRTHSAAPVSLPHATAAAQAPLLEPEGTEGWKVVLTMGAACALICGALFAIWWVGGSTDDDLQASTGDDEAQTFIPSSVMNKPEGTTAGHQPDIERTEEGHLSMAYSKIPEASAPLGVQGRPVAEEDIPALRNNSWNIPRMGSLGMHIDQVMVTNNDGDRWAETATLLRGDRDDDGSVTVVRECQQLDQDDALVPCTAPSYVKSSGTKSITAPYSARVHVYDDGTWSAFMSTDHAFYRVDSNASLDQASAVLTRLAVSEDSQLRAGQLPDTSVDRFHRGLEKIFG